VRDPPIWTDNDAEWSRSGIAQIGMFGASRLGPGRGLVSPDEPPRGPACPGVGNEFPDDVVGQVRVGQADGDQPRATPVFRAGMRPFGYSFCDGLLAEGDVDPLIIKATGETRPTMNTEGRPPAVIVFLGPGKAERKPPHLFGVYPPHVTLLGMIGLRDRSSSFDDWARPRVSRSHARTRRRRPGAVGAADRAHAE